MRLDELPLRRNATVSAIDWDGIGPAEAKRLREFGFDEGVVVQKLHTGPIGSDPVACRVGRMTVALRRRVALAISVTGHEA
ncbi:FeoA family protein [Sphingomonas sp. MM-1]|nr:FeoA family protein [Sphingomonas sp. MM-1]